MPGLWDKIMGTGKKAAKKGVESAKEFDRKMVESHDGSGGGGELSMAGESLTISQRDDGDWEVSNPNGTTLHVFRSKDGARAAAESMTSGSGKYDDYQVLQSGGSGGRDLGFSTGGDGQRPQMPGGVLGGGDRGGSGDHQPQMPDAMGDAGSRWEGGQPEMPGDVDEDREYNFPDLF